MKAANANHRFNRDGWTDVGGGVYRRSVGKVSVFYTPGEMHVAIRGKEYHGVQPEDVLNFIANRVQEDAIAIEKENERRVPVQQVGMSAPKKVAETS